MKVRTEKEHNIHTIKLTVKIYILKIPVILQI